MPTKTVHWEILLIPPCFLKLPGKFPTQILSQRLQLLILNQIAASPNIQQRNYSKLPAVACSQTLEFPDSALLLWCRRKGWQQFLHHAVGSIEYPWLARRR
ncbi:hypothetical protein CEXT_612111 [Caerostris extrusa]|uniref:Uncharacterized protein n=1 Tax=Caerostris extrusa TaxID=172846 RepID=A0AAV4MTZ3_CAEEX|nr:hypothetical protein CEXT_612111 [Caerostris extrusa]